MLKTRQTENRTTKIRRFVVAATALVFGICGVKYFLSNQKQEQKIVQSIPKQRSKVRVLPLTDTLATSFANPSDQIRGRLHLMVIGRDLTQPKPYTIVLGPEQIPKIEHPLDAYSCLIEARARKKDAVNSGETFDEQKFLMERGCPSLGELLLSIQSHPDQEAFDALRRLVADRAEYFIPMIQIPIEYALSYLSCREALDIRDMLNGPSALLIAAQLAVDYSEAEEILVEGVLSDPEAEIMLKARLSKFPPADGKDWDMRSKLIDILDASTERIAQKLGLPEFEVISMRDGNLREAEHIMHGDGIYYGGWQAEFEREIKTGVNRCKDLGIESY